MRQFHTVTPHQRQLLRRGARRMRHEPTHTEWLLWQAIRSRQLGVTFRRQVMLQGYIADFYASCARLIVEVDGPRHTERTRRDARRDRVLASAGYGVLRVTDQQVRSVLPEVVARIHEAIANP